MRGNTPTTIKVALAVAAVLSFLAPRSAHGATAHFTRISVEDGLSQSSVESIAEDRYGFLWFGTQEGLNRFDGYDFTVYEASIRPGYLHDGFIRAVVADRKGDVWVGTLSGLQHLDTATGRFSESITPAGVGVRLNTVRVAGDGRLWFGGSSGGLWTRAAVPGARAEQVAVEGYSRATVTAVCLTDERNVVLAAGGDLLSLQLEEREGTVSVTPRVLLRGAGTIRVIHAEGGMLWLGRTGATVLRVDSRNGGVTEYSELTRSALAIESAGDGRLWIGGRAAGVTRFDPRTRESITYRHEPGNEDSLADNDAAVVHQDRGGNLWVGAWNGGLSRLNLYSQAFRTVRNTPGQPDSLPDDDVTRMTEDAQGRLWSITRNDVLTRGDAQRGSFVTMPLGRDLTTIAAAGDRVFVGTTDGLVEIDALSTRTTRLNDAARAAGLERVRIDGLAGGPDHVWIIAAGTLFRMAVADRGTIERVDLPLREEPTSICEASGTLWIAYEGGVLLRASSANGTLSIERVGGASAAARGRLSAVAESRGTVWLGAARGVGRLNERGVVEWVESEQAMLSRSVASILIDDGGVLWIATERGITRFDPSTHEAVRFGALQGAQASGYVDGGALRGRSGIVYFAGRGLTMFDPRAVANNPYQPRVVFTALEVLHRPLAPSWIDRESPLTTAVHAAKEVALDADAAVFSVQMAALGAGDPDAVRYFHRLEGFDANWIESSAARRVATYTRLAPGWYVLHARAQTQSGVWSAGEATLRIHILAPWWRTRGAMAGWIAAAVFLILVTVREARSRARVRIALAEQEGLRRASFTDPLTGLYNRRFLAAWLKHEIPRALRTHLRRAGVHAHPEFLLFVVADLDNLKDINDRFGHNAGDRAIRAVGDVLQSHARLGDLAVRWGGDEFVLVLRSIDRAEAAHVIARLQRSVETADGEVDAPRPTISLGYAQFPFIESDVNALTWEQTLDLADRALLQSKRRGRNSWTGFVATRATTAASLLHDLAEAVEDAPATVRVVQGSEPMEELVMGGADV